MLVMIAPKVRTRAKRTNQGYPIRYDGVIIIRRRPFAKIKAAKPPYSLNPFNPVLQQALF